MSGGRTQGLHTLKLKTKGNYQARVHSDQIALVMARWETGPHERRVNLRATLSQAKTKGNYQA
jgi:hypothetical protein